MDTKVTRFFDSLKDKKVCFIGVGVSHLDLIRLFVKKGIDVSICDMRERENLDCFDELSSYGVTMHLGADYLEHLDGDIIFRSPGVRFYTDQIVKARQKGAIITSELEVFFSICPCEIIAVTGSDGKTTTTTIISNMLKESGKNVHLGGNIGVPLLPIIESINPDDIAVVELSSFQLISMRNSPNVSVITNIEPNHLDMHADLDEYINAKRNIYLHQNSFGKTVLNEDNEVTKSFCDEVICRLYTFSRETKPENGAFVDADDFICMAHDGGITRLFKTDDIAIPGVHNIENYLAAVTAMWGYVAPSVMEKVAREFGGVEHRIEFVRELDGVKWYNDSIASSPSRTVAGLNSFDKKVILIAGGYDKQISYLPLAPKIIEKVKLLLLMGDTANKIQDTVESIGGYKSSGLKIVRVEDMQDAVKVARENAIRGDIVFMSPASASFDKYKNFDMRGKHFKKIVNELK